MLKKYIRTPTTEAQEILDALMDPSGAVEAAMGNRSAADPGKVVAAITKCQQKLPLLEAILQQCGTADERTAVSEIILEVRYYLYALPCKMGGSAMLEKEEWMNQNRRRP